ncbi:MAG TPA: XrtB/PEP-CTERM-associated polysaccharide biosynthesis outer membrane protein EpsL [Methylophilus sp.]
MLRSVIKLNPLYCLLLCSPMVWAEGMIEVDPYVSAAVTYDSNLFRFAGSSEAQAAGLSDLADVVSRIDAGVNARLNVSRQLFSVSAGVNESQYNQYSFLDNTGKSYRLAWNWRLGNDVYGELASTQSQSIAGFADNDIIVRNLRTFKRQKASINWNLLPSWTLYASREFGEFDNDDVRFLNLDNEDDVYEAGVRYQNTLGTQVSTFYRAVDVKFPNRSGVAELLFGQSSRQRQYGVNVAWLPTLKTRISGQVSRIDLSRDDAPQRNFDGLSQRWTVDYAMTGKTSLNATAYREVIPLDDFLSTFLVFKGVGMNANWAVTSKLALSGGMSYVARDFLGAPASLSNFTEREDETARANLMLSYSPTEKALLQLSYQTESRDANVSIQGYHYNQLNLLARYNF